MHHTQPTLAARMIIGHLGVAFAAKRRWQRAPMGWLIGASFAPDIWRLVLAGSGYLWWPSNTLSHALPWSAVMAVVLGAVAWLTLRDGAAALLVSLLVASHIALDMVSGWKPLWIGGPSGLNVQRVEQMEFILEAFLAWVGWLLLRGTRRPGWLSTKTALLLMVVVQAAYLDRAYTARPQATRCLTYPVVPCRKRL
ncbi:MAG: hypothetical protein ABI664_23720 [bacterium]